MSSAQMTACQLCCGTDQLNRSVPVADGGDGGERAVLFMLVFDVGFHWFW